MWLFVMFDLPVKTTKDRRAYTQFRTALLRDGFMQMQYSVYARYCASEEAARAHRLKVKMALPETGHVRVVAITDRQFGKMESYVRGRHKRDENVAGPQQLLLF